MAIAAISPVAAGASEPLYFNGDGEFKIVQFTDNHYKTGKSASADAVRCIESVIEAEQPDMVMFSGDLVYSEGVAEALDSLMRPLEEKGIPYAFVFGNHDADYDMSHAQIYDYIQQKNGSIVPPRGDVESPDYVLEIMSADSTRVASVLYCIDSHRASPIKGVSKYAWIEMSQILWYRTLSDAYTAANDGTPLPSLMFFHIPLPETQYAYDDEKNFLTGQKGEDVCCPKLNSGLFTSIKEKGDVFAAFYGHDHDNDYAVTYKDVLLAYGRYSGGNTVYNHIGERGARIIVLHQDRPELDTWIRLAETGEIIDKASFPSDFKGKRKKAKKK